jgi:tight adherence protein C
VNPAPGTLGAVAGAIGGVGLWLIAWWFGARRPRLDDRLAPYLRPSTRRVALGDGVASSPFPTIERLLAPVMHDAVRLVERVGSPTADLQRRLVRAGRDAGVEQFRVEQVVAAVLGMAAGLALALAAVAGRGLNPVAGVTLVATGLLTALVVHDQLLSREVRRREQRLLAELPTVAELLALAVAAGEGALGALDRVVRSTHGELTREIGRALSDTRSGTPLTTALERMADRTGLPSLSRFADAISVAVDRGTPLADVLRAQAADIREAGRRSLMEAGGRKEIAMMVPVVFLVLPVTVVFAVFPGLSTLRLTL